MLHTNSPKTSILYNALLGIVYSYSREGLFEAKGRAYGISLFVCNSTELGYSQRLERVNNLINALVKAKLQELCESDMRLIV